MDILRALDSYEKEIENIANQYFSPSAVVDREDFLQVGRLVVLELAETKPEMISNRAYVRGAIRNSIRSEIYKARKRRGEVYLDDPIYPDSDLTYGDKVASQYPNELLRDEKPVLFDIGAGYQRRFERETAEVYYDLLSGRRRRVPNGFWTGDYGRRRARFCFKRFLTATNMTSEEFAKSGPRERLIKGYGLQGAFSVCYGNSIPNLIADTW